MRDRSQDYPSRATSSRESTDAAETARACRRILACFAFVCVYFVGIYPGAPDANQRSHYQLLRALGERGTAQIEPELADFGSHTDVAVHAGHRYSDKAPGLSAAAVPAYRLLRLVLPEPRSTQDWLVFYGARLGSVTLVIVLALAAFSRGAAPESPLLPLWFFALLFATPFQVYARSFFAHAFAAALLLGSFLWLARGKNAITAAGAGALAGIAVASEYPVIVIALCLFVAAASGPVRRLLAFVAGAAVPAIFLMWYHVHYFGGPLSFPTAANETYTVLAGRGVAGISWPRLSAAIGLFFDPAHGLLYFAPFLLLWPIVALLSLRRFRPADSLWVPALAPLLLVVLISGFVPPHWRGGWCLGPRYIVAGFLLVFWLLARRVSPSSPAARVFLLGGIIYGAILTAICGSTFWLIPYESWNPARTVSAHLLKMGIVEYNLGVASGLPPLVSLVPPLAACAVAFLFAVRGAAIAPRTLIASALLGGLTAAGVLAVPPSHAAVENSHREGIAAAIAPAMHVRWR